MRAGDTVTKEAATREALCGGGKELYLSIPSCLEAIEPLCDEIRILLDRRHLAAMQFAVEILARECLNNAVLHGNEGRNNGWVRFGMRVGRKLIRLRVADQGPGFDWRRMRRNRLPAGDEGTGRGLVVARIYAQRVAFNRCGNQVTLWINTAKEGR